MGVPLDFGVSLAEGEGTEIETTGMDFLTQKDDLAPITPIDSEPIELGVSIDGSADDTEATTEKERPSAGKVAGYPIASLFVQCNNIACDRFFSEQLTAAESQSLYDAAAAIEDYYAPDISGPWWLWAQVAIIMSTVYQPRIIAKRQRKKTPRRESEKHESGQLAGESTGVLG